MSRTYRKLDRRGSCYRRFRTLNEKRQIEAIQTDPELKEYTLGKLNRLNRFIPDAYEDVVISAYYEQDYKLKEKK